MAVNERRGRIGEECSFSRTVRIEAGSEGVILLPGVVNDGFYMQPRRSGRGVVQSHYSCTHTHTDDVAVDPGIYDCIRIFFGPGAFAPGGAAPSAVPPRNSTKTRTNLVAHRSPCSVLSPGCSETQEGHRRRWRLGSMRRSGSHSTTSDSVSAISLLRGEESSRNVHARSCSTWRSPIPPSLMHLPD
jgi:hypothetical protein